MFCQKLNLLGEGTYGTVFLAQYYSPFLNVPMEFAVKSSKVKFSDFVRMEGQILRKLRGCPYIIWCFGEDTSVEDGNAVYNLLLHLDLGGTLQSLIKSRGGFIPEFEVSFYAYQFLKGIRHVHRHDFVHCDFMPSNVLLFPCNCGCGRNHLKIADFGLSKVAGVDIFGGAHRGSFLYTSPKSLFCDVHEAPKDIWAIGCMVAEMMAGKPPWGSCNGISKDEFALDMALNQPKIPNGISYCAKDFLMRCFERNPNASWTADKLLNHSFVANHYNPLKCKKWEDLQTYADRLFDTKDWISTTHLFSTPIPAFTCGSPPALDLPSFSQLSLN